MANKDSRSLLDGFDPSTIVSRTRKLAAWSIDTSENLARGVLDLQQQATRWAKDTPLAKLFEAQKTFAERVIDNSAKLARTLWQVEKGEDREQRA